MAFVWLTIASTLVHLPAGAPAEFFFQVLANYGPGKWERKSPGGVQGWSLDGVWGKAPRSRRQVVKIMHKNSSTERFAVTANSQNTLQHFQRGKCLLLPMPAGANVCRIYSILTLWHWHYDLNIGSLVTC